MQLIIANDSSTLSLTDRAIQYGDGCFTTIHIAKGQPQLFEYHQQRLQNACQTLCIDQVEWQNLFDAVKRQGASFDNQVLKILISRGSGGRGYLPATHTNPTAIISLHPYPEHYLQWQQNGIRVDIAQTQLGLQPLLAGIKHLNRLEQVFIRQEVEHHQADDLIVCDINGYVVETSASNLFWYTDGLWFTPLLDQAGIEGVYRRHLIGVLKKQGFVVQEVRAKPSALHEANAMLICNSLMHVVPVRLLCGRELALAPVLALQEAAER